MNKDSFQWFNKDNYAQCYWHLYEPIDFYNQIEQSNDFFLSHKDDSQQLIDNIHFWFICCAIYSSNSIEDSGASLSETRSLISNFFLMDGLKESQDLDKLDAIKKKEVNQHAKAYKFLCQENKGKKLSEELILETHKILMDGLKREDGVDSNAGSYRSSPITVGRSGIPCTDPEIIQKHIKYIINYYNNQNELEKGNDPFYNAAKLKYSFLHIHPFVDGNGRLSRLLLNWSLLSNGLPFPVALQAGFSYRSRKNYFNCFKANNPDKFLSSLVLESVNIQFCSILETLRFSKYLDSVPNLLSKDTYFTDLSCWKFKNYYSIDTMRETTCLLNQKYSSDEYKELRNEFFIKKAFDLVTHSKKGLEGSDLKLANDKILPILNGCDGPDTKEVSFNCSHSRSLNEMVCLARAFKFLCIDGANNDLSPELILKTISLISPTKNNIIREEQVFIGSHLFPPPYCIENSLKKLVDMYNVLKLNGTDRIVLSSWLMYQLLALYPFSDGNGRLSRLFCSWSLLSNGSILPVSFGNEKGVNKGNKTLMVCVQNSRSNVGIPSALSTRILLSLFNSLNNLDSKQKQ
ncbi:hypothetical protein ACTFIW_006538 [Dictyostelium discoideum]